MSTQYDAVAEDYQTSKRLPVFEVFEHTLLTRLGDVRGQSILDFACGEGFHTRRLKELGAGRTVGVDISEEMIRLAREQEKRQPLGIEYIKSSAQQLGKIGEFDLVTAVFLLNYGESRDDLVKICQAVYDNLKPGQRFFTINDNCGKGAARPDGFRRYGFGYEVGSPLGDGDKLGLQILVGGASWITIEFRCFFRETYEWALRTAGFTAVTWHDLVVPPELESKEGKEFWDGLREGAPVTLIECWK